MNNLLNHSFNWWIVVLILGLILMAVIGSLRFVIVNNVPLKKNGHLRVRYQDRFLKIISGTLTLITWLLFVIESNRGVLQFFDNCRGPQDSAGIAAWMAVATIAVMPVVFYGMFYAVGETAGYFRLGRTKRVVR